MKLPAFPQPRQGSDDTSISGLALLAMSVASEITQSVSPAQAHGFFQALGRRMAEAETLDGVNDTSALNVRLNAFWKALDWGVIDLQLGDDGILVHHRGLPLDLAADDQAPWIAMLSGVLEGAYDSWFRTLGSGPALHTKAKWKGDVLELRHGL